MARRNATPEIAFPPPRPAQYKHMVAAAYGIEPLELDVSSFK